MTFAVSMLEQSFLCETSQLRLVAAVNKYLSMDCVTFQFHCMKDIRHFMQ